MENKLTVHVRHIERTLRVSAIALFFALSVWLLRDILLLLFSAVVIACVLRGASDAVRRVTRLGPYTALISVILVTGLALGALLWWRGSAIFNQADEISRQLRTQLSRIWDELQNSSWGSILAQQLQIAGKSLRTGLTGYVTGVVGSVLGIGGTLVVTAATAVFLAASPQLYLEGSLRLLPMAWRPRGRHVAGELGATLRLWFLGQLVDMLIVGVLLGLGLLLIGSPLPLSLALLAALLNFVPYIGALAGAVPAILVALAQSPVLAAWVALLFLTIQLLEGNVIAPWIQKRTVSLPPALTILSQTVLGTLFGLIGLIVATPLIAVLLVAVRMIYVEAFLERESRPASLVEEHH
ncbi:AI-2E family transporter [Bradyrhizobium sp. 62]|uniref:AI-2E family transporter n=1 Tax=Bradyrhizobium sp. 62 TaxID=1043588 RepID=UPI001FF7AA07|nr:AI-2E family transporter [Bradyrhizobium sp. 62]MCK1362877.1 AI-2E family transporter [Bradyrhizobium sp. 62]